MTTTVQLKVFERTDDSVRVIDEATVSDPSAVVDALDRFNSKHGLAQTAHRWVEGAEV